jgi:hypothetical protein
VRSYAAAAEAWRYTAAYACGGEEPVGAPIAHYGSEAIMCQKASSLLCLVVLVCIPATGLIGALSGCGGNTANGPTTPSLDAPRYDGQWKGTTSQGRPITFTVSLDQKVTAITVGYSFSGCSGLNAFSGLNLDIGNGPNPATSLGPGFGSGPPDGPNYTQVYGSFSSNTTATGSMIFGDYPSCGNAAGIWTATRN